MPLTNWPHWTWGLFAGATLCAIASSFLIHSMIVELNRRLPAADRINVLGDYPGKLYRIIRLHGREFPRSSTRRALFATMFCFFGLTFLAVFPRMVEGFLATLQEPPPTAPRRYRY